MPPGFVAALFDQYADRFDRHLQGSLGYRGPAVVAAAIECVAPGRRFGASLDLGCGTGLMARHLTDRTAALDGVDLSPRMIEQARATGLYRNLAVADLAQALRQSPDDAYDLILAADVFVYVGALDAVLQRIAAVLRPAGLLAFTVQHGDHPGFELGADMRFSHGSAYVEATLADAGLRVALIEAQSTRRDGGIDVPGLVVVATRA